MPRLRRSSVRIAARFDREFDVIARIVGLGGARGGPALIEALIDRQITSLPVPANRPSFSSQARLVSVPALTTLFQLESLVRAVSSSLSRQVTASRGLLGFRHTPEGAHYLKRAS